VLYLEVGQWGQLVVQGERRNVSFAYDHARSLLAVRIAPLVPALESELRLNGTVRESDTTVILYGDGSGVLPFEVRLKRTRAAPWPPDERIDHVSS
jgi:hypothetical protein